MSSDILTFMTGFVIGLVICYSLYYYIAIKIQEHNWKKFKEHMRDAKNNVIRDSDGEVIWREDIGLCGKATYI